MSMQHDKDQISLIVYDEKDAPRFFHFEKKTLTFVFITIPILVVLSWIVVAIFTYINSNNQNVLIPAISKSAAPEEIQELESEVSALQKMNENLSKKLVSSIPETGTSAYLSLLTAPPGMKNLISKNSISLQEIKFSKTDTQTEISFNLINISKEFPKILGHIWIFEYDAEGVQVYPVSPTTSGLSYNQGETFSVAKLRPTKAVFKQLNTADAKSFHIVLMSRDGDLILSQTLGPFTGAQ
jgi:hypothetical protein